MVGRRHELKAAKDAVAGTGAVVLAGRPGVGKTRLAQELLKDRRAHGWATAWVVGGKRGQPLVPPGAHRGCPAVRPSRPDPWTVATRWPTRDERATDRAHQSPPRRRGLRYQRGSRGGCRG